MFPTWVLNHEKFDRARLRNEMHETRLDFQHDFEPCFQPNSSVAKLVVMFST